MASTTTRNGNSPESVTYSASGPMTTRDIRMPRGQRSTAPDPFSEIGTSGLKQYGGFVLEEWLRQLAGKRAAWAYREMLDNSSVVGAILFAIEMLSRQATWRVEGSDEEVVPGLLATQFVDGCMHDMSHTWGDFVSEALSMLPYGWALHEEVLKRRLGQLPLPDEEDVPMTEEADPPASSQFEDGLIGWRKLPIRAQESLQRWHFVGYAGLRGMEQIDWHGGRHIIPIEKALLFRTKATRGNPEGRSILRNAYESYYYMKNIQTDEAIGISRDLAGIPKLQAPEGLDIWAEQHKDLFDQATDLVTSVEKDEQQGIVLPFGWVFDLVKSGGARQVDTDAVIRRYRQEIASSVLSDFIHVGLDNLGSYAMVDVKAQLFGIAVDAVLDMICETMNRYAIPRLFRINGFTVKTLPRINHSSTGRVDLEKVGNFLYHVTASGLVIPWADNPEMVEQLFGEAGMPINFKGESTQNVHKAQPVELAKADQGAGAMVALYPSSDVAQSLAQPGGEPADALHVTLGYLGKAADLEDTDRLHSVVEGFAASCPPLEGQVSGVGQFTAGPEPVTYASVDAPALPAARERLTQSLEHAGFPPSSDHGFTPHMTLAYDKRDAQVANHPLKFDHVALALGGQVHRFPLTGVRKADDPNPKGVVSVAPQLAERARVLSLGLEQEMHGALKHLGEQAATAYMSSAHKARLPMLGSAVKRVMRSLNLQRWIDDRLMPILRNHAARVAGDTQRVLQTEIGQETRIATEDVAKLEGDAGRHLHLADIEPQVRDAIMQAIAEGVSAGDNPAATANRIRDMVPAGRFTHAGPAGRARLIARAETLHAQRLATLAAYDTNPHIQNVMVRDGIFGPPRSDAECIDRSGEVVPLAEARQIAPELHPQCSVSYDPIVEAARAAATV